MLQELHVKNFALMDDVEVEFHEGLNILSGETGAGKSIIMGSIAMALGAKTSRDYIRHGCSYAYVELGFKVNDAILSDLQDLDIEPDEGMVIISRKITENKSNCRINGEAVSMSRLREAAGLLIDIHGQQDNQILTKPGRQLDILDSYAGADLQLLLEQYADTYAAYRKVKEELSSVDMDENARLREVGYLEFVLQEIDEAKLSEEEEEDLAITFRKMNNSKNLKEGLEEIRSMLFEDDRQGSASDRVSDSIRTVTHLLGTVGEDEQLQEISDVLYDLENMMNDLSHTISAYSDSMDHMEEEYKRVTDRLDQIYDLKNKYGRTIEDVLNYREEQANRLEELKNYEARREENERLFGAYQETLNALADEMHGLRERTADRLSQAVSEALSDLNFINSQFEICLSEAENGVFFANGRDKVTYMISPNPGEPLKPVAEIASGGELSRIMLALKAVLASADTIDTFIFDEIDAGISGRTAQKVAEKLLAISKDHQIICISHLPQIVAMADYHYLIEKYARDQVTRTEITQLEYEESVNEIARLLGGTVITQTVIDSAWEMKELAQKAKY